MVNNRQGECLVDWIEDVAGRLDLQVDQVQVDRILRYIDLLREWNQQVNLTAILDDEGIAVRHLLDSLTLVKQLDKMAEQKERPLRLIDVGSGAGFPGLPLKIFRPALDVVLLDSLNKRVRFLEAVITSLELDGISARHGRAEEAARQPDLRERFDVATARAVASLPVLCEYCLPFVQVGGEFIAMKGHSADEASESTLAIKTLGGELAGVREFNLPATDMKRTIITIRKINATPAAYPRKAGKPEREPITDNG